MLESIFSLTDDERDALATLPMQVQDTQADQDIVREGRPPVPLLSAAGRLRLHFQDDRRGQAPDHGLPRPW
jgi:hypothetical protein